MNSGEVGFLCICRADERDRTRAVFVCSRRVCGMAVSTANVVPTVFTTSQVVALFPAGVTGQTRLRDLLRRFVLKPNDLCRVAFLVVKLAGTMTSLTSCNLILPAGDAREVCVRGYRERFKLIFMAVFTSVATNIIRIIWICRFDDFSVG